VAQLVRLYQIPLADLLIIYDDMDLPLGRIRLRARGSAGGHNGVKSIIAALDSQSFPRLRVGIGHPEAGEAADHVLGGFLPEEKAVLSALLDHVSEAVLCFIREGIVAAMNRYNARELKPDQP
jgi:PTH1 family peptidyl-tRNA hydrolase